MSSVKKPVVIKGKLSFKGSTKSKPKQTNSLKNPPNAITPNDDPPKGVVVLTNAQLKHRERKLELETRDKKKMVDIPYRDRIEAFNAKLSTMTEHNDIPRISAAGNG